MDGRRSHWLLWLLAVPSILLAGVVKHVDHQHWTGKYDHHFKKYAKHYFGPGFDWRWFKAQGIAESGLKANAKSPAGARGIMQIMPATFEEIREKNPHFKNITDPHWNIAAAIWYDRQLYRRWKEKAVAKKERIKFAFGSYNAGFAKLYRAFSKLKQKDPGAGSWIQLEPHAPKETRRYVRRIHQLMRTEDSGT